MADRRIQIAKDKGEIVATLLEVDDSTGPFKHKADVLAFAASYGASENRSEPIGDSTMEPIRQDVFTNCPCPLKRVQVKC